MAISILVGDCRELLAELPDQSVHCCVTSPPYFGLRDYGCDGQIGLEATPDAFVAELVAVFREVRRVLRDDGTLWLNLGDSYASGNRATYRSGASDNKGQTVQNDQPRPRDPPGIKPKDLLGIPWMVAKALQAPYYTGRIKDERDRIWLAAMIDGEGCMFLHCRKIGQSNGQGYVRKANTYGAGLEVANTHRAIVERCMEIAGAGSICRQDKERKQPLYRWNLRSNECREIIREIYPHLVAKQHQARLLLGCPSSGPEAEAAHAGLIALHNGQPCEADFPAPESMFERGWYLRQDIIWSKSNPMPESVTDRCTKAHEYLFLLSKSARYHFDADAIAEAQASDHTAGNLTHKGQSAYEAGAGEHRTKAGLVEFAKRSRVQSKRAAELAESAGLTDAHLAAIRAVGITDVGKARVTQDGTGNNDPAVQALADEAKAALGGYYREFLISAKRNKRSVWEIATQPFSEAHFATFPPALIEPCILAGCPKGCMVLDPFGGAGTTGLVADRLGRDCTLIELNPAYAAIATNRLRDDAGMFAEIAP